MRGRTSAGTDLFNFSFLDIFACSLGAFLFLLILIIMNLTEMVDVDNVAKVRIDEEANLADVLAHKRRIEADIADIGKDIEHWDHLMDSGQLSKQLSDLKAKRTELQDEHDAMVNFNREYLDRRERSWNKRKTNEMECTGLSRRLSELKKHEAFLEKELANFNVRIMEVRENFDNARKAIQLRESPQFRIAVLKETEMKNGAIFVCEKDRIYHVSSENFEFIGVDKDFNVTGTRFFPKVEDGQITFMYKKKYGKPVLCVYRMKASAQFDTPESIDSSFQTTHLYKELGKLSRSSQYISFRVKPSGFSAFRQARNLLVKNGYYLYWSPYKEDMPFVTWFGTPTNRVYKW